MKPDEAALCGKPLFFVIKEICSAVSARWSSFTDDIDISQTQRISCGDPDTISRGLSFYGDEPTQAEVNAANDKAAFTDALRLLFQEITQGRFVVEGCRLPMQATSQYQRLSKILWMISWHLQLSAGGTASLTILNNTGGPTTTFLLGNLEAGSAEMPNVKADTLPARRVRGKSKQDEPLLVMMENLIRSGEAESPWKAAEQLVYSNKVLGGAADRSKIIRLQTAYVKSGRPVEAAASSFSQVSQK